MGALAKLRAEARKLGVTVEVRKDSGRGLSRREGDPLNHEITIEAPAGKVWEGMDIHEIVARGEDIEKVAESVLVDVLRGAVKCDIEDCEWCEGAQS